jgi:hypothetical protein
MSPEVKLTAVSAIRNLKLATEESVLLDSLKALLNDSSMEIREHANQTLQELGSHNIIPIMDKPNQEIQCHLNVATMRTSLFKDLEPRDLSLIFHPVLVTSGDKNVLINKVKELGSKAQIISKVTQTEYQPINLSTKGTKIHKYHGTLTAQ